MSTNIPEFSDNVRVRRGDGFNEFLAISLRQMEQEKDRRFRVYVYRYCVPGRCDIYSFQLCRECPTVVRYFSDFAEPLSKVAAICAKDFDRPEVVEMCVEAFNADRIALHYGNDFTTLLEYIAPKSKSLKRTRAIYERARKAMQERIAKGRAERDAEPTPP